MTTQVKRTFLQSCMRWTIILAGTVILAFCLIIGFLTIKDSFFSEKAYLEKAQQHEQNYHLLARGSINHAKICNAALDALKYYQKANDQEKIKLFEYIIVDDKCL